MREISPNKWKKINFNSKENLKKSTKKLIIKLILV